MKALLQDQDKVDEKLELTQARLCPACKRDDLGLSFLVYQILRLFLLVRRGCR